MRLAIFGATGDVGSRLVAEAVRRNHDVTAVSRSTRAPTVESTSVVLRELDVLAQPRVLRDIVGGQDAILSALRPPAGREQQLLALTRAVVEASHDHDVPVFVVGGAANLHLPGQHEHTLLSAPGGVPDTIRPIAEACVALERYLMKSSSRWLCLRPAAELLPGPRTQRYVLGDDGLVTDEKGRSHISMEDYAVAMLDLVASPPGFGIRLAVGWAESFHASNGSTAV